MAGAREIEDVCWELFGGGCGVLQTLDEMIRCDRKIRQCDVFISAFREAAALRAEAVKPARKEAPKKEEAQKEPAEKPPAEKKKK